MTNLEFKEIRKKLKMKQAEIAEAIGVGTRAVSTGKKAKEKYRKPLLIL
jgi:DNA-binding transcriptional regulator YiaG